jgi:hypothetical protein
MRSYAEDCDFALYERATSTRWRWPPLSALKVTGSPRSTRKSVVLPPP